MTNTFPPDTQVLVVGAGPTGLVLAAQLLTRGIRTRVIDKAEIPGSQSRAVGVHAGTLELLDTMGLADGFIARGHRVPHLRMYAGRRQLLDLGPGHNGSRFEFTLHLAQSETEKLLIEHVHQLGGTVERGVELVRLAESGTAVEATLRDAAGREVETTAAYVVGCDGAHSRVRHQLGVPFEGRPYPQDWLLADAALDGPISDDAVHIFIRPNGLPLTCVPMGAGRWRVVMPNAGERAGADPSFEEIQRLVGQRAPLPITLSDPIWLSCFRCHLRTAASYRRGRVLLAGDAAHVHSPAGGQGMNTGMMDADNLAWKLALVADGLAPDALLDTYEAERRPVAAGVLASTDKLVGIMTERRPVKRALRRVVLPAATALPTVRRRVSARLSQTSVAYSPGPLVRPDVLRGGPKPGQRCPDIEVRTAGSAATARLHRVLGQGRHVVVATGDAGAALASCALNGLAPLVDVVEGNLGAAFTLVRPDRIVAVRGREDELSRVADYLGVFGAVGQPSADGSDTPTSELVLEVSS